MRNGSRRRKTVGCQDTLSAHNHSKCYCLISWIEWISVPPQVFESLLYCTVVRLMRKVRSYTTISGVLRKYSHTIGLYDFRCYPSGFQELIQNTHWYMEVYWGFSHLVQRNDRLIRHMPSYLWKNNKWKIEATSGTNIHNARSIGREID